MKILLKYSDQEKSKILYNFFIRIKDLTSLLDKNKEFYIKYKETNEMLDNKKKEIEDMKITYNTELKEQFIKNSVNSNEIDLLQSKIKELEKEIKKNEELVDNWRREAIDDKTLIKKLTLLNEQKKENIFMLNEEIDMWLFYYEQEKNEHQKTKFSLEALENRIIREREKDKQGII